jgi:hypothetical protein
MHGLASRSQTDKTLDHMSENLCKNPAILMGPFNHNNAEELA